MADLAVTSGQDLSFSNSNAGYTTAAVDTTGQTWACLIATDFLGNAGVAATITSATYNGVSILGNFHANAALANWSAGEMALMPFALGGSAGNHTFTIAWSSANFLDFQVIWGSGDLHASVVDRTYVDQQDVGNGTTCTLTAYAPVSDKALPIFGLATEGLGVGTTANSGCTKRIQSGLDGGVAFYSCPLSTPAGTATAAVLNTTSASHTMSVFIALKPAGGGSGTVVPVFMNQYRQRR